ncbi:MAG: hypothetical protein Q4A54_01840 [Parabacteroides sp.]|nr:hypothetical protein [Parabacteroides sp.]
MEPNKEFNWLEWALFVLSLGFFIYSLYNIHFSVLETMKWFLAGSFCFSLVLAFDEKVLRVFTKLELIKIALFKNIYLFGIFIAGTIYNIVRGNDELVAKFILAIISYFMIILTTDTWEHDGGFVAIFSLIITVLLLFTMLSGGAGIPFILFIP